MKQYPFIVLSILCICSLNAEERSSNNRQIYQVKRSKSLRPDAVSETVSATQNIAALCCTCATLEVPINCRGLVVAGIIEMPSMDQMSGSGPGFTFIADATNGTIIITFEQLIQPVVIAMAQNQMTALSVQIIARTNNTVTLQINGFVAAEPTFVDFFAIELACSNNS